MLAAVEPLTSTLAAVEPLTTTVTAMEAKYDAMFSKLQTSIQSTMDMMAQLKSGMQSLVTANLVELKASTSSLASTVPGLNSSVTSVNARLATIQSSVAAVLPPALPVTSVDSRLATVESSLIEVQRSTTRMVDGITKLSATLTFFLATHPSNVSRRFPLWSLRSLALPRPGAYLALPQPGAMVFRRVVVLVRLL